MKRRASFAVRNRLCLFAALTLSSVSCGGTTSPPETGGPADSTRLWNRSEAEWCNAVASAAYPHDESDWKCAWPPGAHVIGEYGPEKEISSAILGRCFEAQDQTLAKLKNPDFDASRGEINLNFERSVHIDAGAGLRLSEMDLGAWVPDITINAESDVEMVIRFSIKDYSIQRYFAFGAEFVQSSASRDACKVTLCDPTTRIIRAAVVASPVVTIQFKNNASGGARFGWNVAGVHGDVKDLAGGGWEIKNFKEKVTVAYQVGSSAQMMSAAKACPSGWNDACTRNTQYKEVACNDYYYAPGQSRERCFDVIDRMGDIIGEFTRHPELREACWICHTRNCLNRFDCKITDHYDAEAYACLSHRARYSCADALAAKHSNANIVDDDKEYIRFFYNNIGGTNGQACPAK